MPGRGEEFSFKGESWENWVNSCISAWRKANNRGEQNSPFHAVCRCDNPVAGDDGAPADVGALHVQADLPWPLPQHGPVATHDPVRDAHALTGQATLWKVSHTQGLMKEGAGRWILHPRLPWQRGARVWAVGHTTAQTPGQIPGLPLPRPH